MENLQNGKPSIVLVHGALSDGSVWSRVILILAREGFNVIAVQNTMASLAEDVVNTRCVIDSIDGSVVVVGHSYGGAVISGAATGAENVLSLVYVAAFAPDEGESMAQLSEPFPVLPSANELAPDSAGFLYFNRANFAYHIAHDVEPEQGLIMAAVHRPFAAAIFGEKAGAAAWHRVPTFYLISEDDRMVQPDLQRWTANRMGATTISLKSSHASPVSHPAEIAELIRKAATAGA